MAISFFKRLIKSKFNFTIKLKVVSRFLKWQISQFFNRFPIIYPFTENSKLIIKKSMTGATGNLYYGLDEFNDMSFLLNFLRKKDLFIDIGANIGSYTILASAEIGAKTISIEPAPSTFGFLKDNILLNNILNSVEAHNIGLAKNKGHIRFTDNLDTVNHVATNKDENTIKIKVNSLDKIIGKRNPSLIKIDVEGFELEILKGSNNTLKKQSLKAIIIELNGLGNRYGYDDKEIDKKLTYYGFLPYKYDPFSRLLSLINIQNKQHKSNLIYIRDIAFVERRVDTARKIKINNFFVI